MSTKHEVAVSAKYAQERMRELAIQWHDHLMAGMYEHVCLITQGYVPMALFGGEIDQFDRLTEQGLKLNCLNQTYHKCS